MIQCKFVCNEITKRWDAYTTNEDGTKGRFLYNYKFAPVCSGSEENKKFWQYTPSGSFEVSTVRIDAFTPGKEYYFDIREAS